VILVQCDCCGSTTTSVWDYRKKLWRAPAAWDKHSLWDLGAQIAKHACSEECRQKLRAKMDEDPDVKFRRQSFRLVAGGKDGG